jgi:hypothetical protein
MAVELSPLPGVGEQLIVCGTVCRKPLPVLQAYLHTLGWQAVPPKTRLHFVYVPDFTPDQADAAAYLQNWVAERGGEILRGGGPGGTPDFSDAGGATHHWTTSAMRRVGDAKNRILRRALELRADAVWFVDADLLLDPRTLVALRAVRQPIVCGVYWTRWHKPTADTVIHAAPQVWLTHPYGLSGRGRDEAEFRRRLIERQLTQVWGQGACTLIDIAAIKKGVDFSVVPDLPTDGMWAGEDRHFCVRAERLHIPMFADPWPDIFHAYHLPDQIAEIDGQLARMAVPRPEFPRVGDLVNLTLEALEPVPGHRGLTHVGPQPVRGRLGGMKLMPDLEDAVLGMRSGDDRIVAMHCGLDHPLEYFRGRRRLIRVTLHDHKPYRFAPVIENEVFVSQRNPVVWMDQTQMTPDLVALMAEPV